LQPGSRKNCQRPEANMCAACTLLNSLQGVRGLPVRSGFAQGVDFMAPRFMLFTRLLSHVLFVSLFTLVLIALPGSPGLHQLLAQAPPVTNAGAVVSRSPDDLERLLPMELQPPVDVSPNTFKPAAQPAAKIPKKYDVSLIGQRKVDQGVNFYSIDKEIAMGKGMAQELEAQSQMLSDAVVCNYVEELGQRLARSSDIKEPLIIKVVDSDEVNAYALPGGYFYVNTGLILAAQSEAELTAVMAHEIAHIAARHATKNMTKVQIWNLASIPMMFFGGPIGMVVQQVSALALPLSINKFSRDAEREADLLGIEYQYAAGYDPNAFIEFFERLKTGRKPNAVAQAFATHPMNQERIRKAQKTISTLLPPHDDYVVDTSQFHAMQQRLLGRLQIKTAPGATFGNGPVLRRDKAGTQSPKGQQPDDQQPDDQQSDRPTLKRR
jgi:Zn-dependent protease with chaperone function